MSYVLALNERPQEQSRVGKRAAMKTIHGNETGLTADAELLANDLALLGAQFTSGHRDLPAQAQAMAENVSQHRQWISQTYLHAMVVGNSISERTTEKNRCLAA